MNNRKRDFGTVAVIFFVIVAVLFMYSRYMGNRFYTQFGLKPPPRGYDYHWDEPGVPYLDKNGDPVLRRLDEPAITIEMGIGFAPTLEEMKRHKQLMDARLAIYGSGDAAEIARLEAEIEALEASAQGMRPLSVSSSSTTAEQASKADHLRKEKYNAALREYGLEHLISYKYRDGLGFGTLNTP